MPRYIYSFANGTKVIYTYIDLVGINDVNKDTEEDDPPLYDFF